MDYSKFIHNFKTNIDCRDIDDRQKLTYLIQFCSGKAKNCVEPFIFCKPSQGYQSALQALGNRFGMPHVIAKGHLDCVVNGPILKNEDIEKLEQLSADMNNCGIILEGMKFKDDLNSSDNLRKIVRRLPYHLKCKWVDKAYTITEKTGREADLL